MSRFSRGALLAFAAAVSFAGSAAAQFAAGAGAKAGIGIATRPVKTLIPVGTARARSFGLGRGMAAIARTALRRSVERAFAIYRASGRGVRLVAPHTITAADARDAAARISAVLGLQRRSRVAAAIPDTAVDPRVAAREIAAAVGRTAVPRLSRVTVLVSAARVCDG